MRGMNSPATTSVYPSLVIPESLQGLSGIQVPAPPIGVGDKLRENDSNPASSGVLSPAPNKPKSSIHMIVCVKSDQRPVIPVEFLFDFHLIKVYS